MAHPPTPLFGASPQRAVRSLIEYLGEDADRPGLKQTPERVVRALAELTDGYDQDPREILKAQFDDRCDEMVIVRGIRFSSLCEHHMLPFTGTVTIGYLPGSKVVGLSKLPRLVVCFAHRLQVQERLTVEIADAIQQYLSPNGVGVLIKARHSCMGVRGAMQPEGEMITSSLLGAMRDEPEARAEFLTLANGG